MYDDGLHGDSLAGDGLYGARIAPPATEDQHSVSLTTYDLTNGMPYKLTQAAHFFSSGPVELVGRAFWGPDTLPHPGDILWMNLTVRNQGLLDTLKNVSLNVVPLDTFIMCNNQSNNLPMLAPGTSGSTGWAFLMTIHPSTPGGTNHAVKVDVYSNTYPAWTDTILLYVYPLVGVEEGAPGIPLVTRLEQNYPNPFNPSTEIGFQITDHGLVTMKIYDELGREVVTLLNEVKQPGVYTVRWDASEVASGVYLCRLQAGQFSSVQKMVLVR
jgi:hypothetical protein